MWIEELLAGVNRRTVRMTFNPHLILRESHRNLDLDRVEETVRTGKTNEDKSNPPAKIRFRRYYGKENLTYDVVVVVHQNYWEVMTSWKKKGR